MTWLPRRTALAALLALCSAALLPLDSFAETGTVQDIDGNTYATVRIGDQWWMAENLRVTHDPQGNAIASLVYANNPSYEADYGRMYTWATAMNGSTDEVTQGIAPDGWRIPTEADWQTLFDYLGGAAVAGGKMKEAGLDHWNAPNTGATNESGFGGRAAGSYGGMFEGLGDGTHYWSTKRQGTNVFIPTLHATGADVLLLYVPQSFSVSVRCVRDEDVPVERSTWSRVKGLGF